VCWFDFCFDSYYSVVFLMDVFNSYINQDFLSFLGSLVGPLFAAGILLGITAWIVSYLVFVTIRFFRM